MKHANDNEVEVHEGSGNVFVDLGLDAHDAELARLALAEFHAKGGIPFEHFKRLLAEDATRKGEA